MRLTYIPAKLIGVDFSWARMIGANLRGAKMIGADLSEAVLESALLGGADLSNAAILNAKLWHASFDEKTVLQNVPWWTANFFNTYKIITAEPSLSVPASEEFELDSTLLAELFRRSKPDDLTIAHQSVSRYNDLQKQLLV